MPAQRDRKFEISRKTVNCNYMLYNRRDTERHSSDLDCRPYIPEIFVEYISVVILKISREFLGMYFKTYHHLFLPRQGNVFLYLIK
jgi:hypothetical protein